MDDLDKTFNFTVSSNSEIAFIWYKLVITKNYTKSYPAIEDFLIHVGRIKFVVPLFRALAADESGKAFAKEIYQKAKEGYHPLTQSAVEKILKF